MSKKENLFQKKLHEAGYKVTPSRLAILKFLFRERHPVTVPELLKKLHGQDIDMVTAYRTLSLLKNIGLVRSVDFQHGAAYYELSPETEHHHVVCTKCERVQDVENCCIEKDMQSQALQQTGFATITAHSLEFFGLCNECV